MYLTTGQRAEAKAAFEAALKCDAPATQQTLGPMFSCYHALINIALDEEDAEASAALYKDAMDRAAEVRKAAGDSELAADALLQEGYLELKYGSLEKAADIANQVVEKGLTFQGYVLQGLLEEIRGDPAKAMTLYAMASRGNDERMPVAKAMINRAAQGESNVTGLRRPIDAVSAPAP